MVAAARPLMEEAREILKTAQSREPAAEPNLAETIRRYIDPVGGVELAIPPREPVRRAPKFIK